MPTPEIVSELQKKLSKLEDELIVTKWQIREAQDRYERVIDAIGATKKQLFG